MLIISIGVYLHKSDPTIEINDNFSVDGEALGIATWVFGCGIMFMTFIMSIT